MISRRFIWRSVGTGLVGLGLMQAALAGAGAAPGDDQQAGGASAEAGAPVPIGCVVSLPPGEDGAISIAVIQDDNGEVEVRLDREDPPADEERREYEGDEPMIEAEGSTAPEDHDGAERTTDEDDGEPAASTNRDGGELDAPFVLVIRGDEGAVPADGTMDLPDCDLAADAPEADAGSTQRQADDGDDDAISPAEAIDIATGEIDGEFQSVVLERKDGVSVYVVTIDDEEVVIDARTGEIVAEEP